MNPPATETAQGAPASSASRMIGAIASPSVTMPDVANRPSWIAPVVVYLAVFLLGFSVFSMRADWVAIVTQQIENVPFMSLLSEAQMEEAIRQETAQYRTMRPAQSTMAQLIKVMPSVVVWHQLVVLVYCTLFVMMGAVPKLELGKAWVNFLVCLGVLIVSYVILGVAKAAFSDAIPSQLMLSGLAALGSIGAWAWLLNRRARADAEYHGMLSVYFHASMVFVLMFITLMVLVLVTPAPIQTPFEKMVKANLGALVQTGVPALQIALEWVDLFWIWFVALLTLGFKTVTRQSLGLTLSITALPFVAFVLLWVAATAAFG